MLLLVIPCMSSNNWTLVLFACSGACNHTTQSQEYKCNHHLSQCRPQTRALTYWIQTEPGQSLWKCEAIHFSTSQTVRVFMGLAHQGLWLPLRSSRTRANECAARHFIGPELKICRIERYKDFFRWNCAVIKVHEPSPTIILDALKPWSDQFQLFRR